jgi:hypothetical protein
VLSPFLEIRTAVAMAPPAVLGSSYGFIEHIHEHAPATGAPWTAAALDAVQAGLEVAP